jgi:hypothetical protein
MEIHALVTAMSPEYEGCVGAPLTMHSGINTGLVVTADVDPTRGTHGIAGDAVNVAARLSDLAGPGEIFSVEETVRRARGSFVFDDLGPRPDLSRTYMEVGKRLLKPKSTYKELIGISATAYLDKAETMFRGMDLEWELEQLERVRQRT